MCFYWAKIKHDWFKPWPLRWYWCWQSTISFPTDNVTECQGSLPEVELNATYKASGEKVKCFRKYVQIRLNKVPNRLPRDVSIKVDDEYVEKGIPCHRYYTVKENKIILFTKHFSIIKFFNCNIHQGSTASHVTAKIFKRRGSSWDTRELKVLLIPVRFLYIIAKAKLIFFYLSLLNANTKLEYQGVKEFHMLALISCYCKMIVFSPFKLGDTCILSLIQG